MRGFLTLCTTVEPEPTGAYTLTGVGANTYVIPGEGALSVPVWVSITPDDDETGEFRVDGVLREGAPVDSSWREVVAAFEVEVEFATSGHTVSGVAMLEVESPKPGEYTLYLRRGDDILHKQRLRIED
ncbi:MAG: hypothetical protein AB7K09_02395 [Planctomycetota bacterium]